ncbi:chemotaxis response regulator protein-glutamate methylesterase CheB [Lachnospiraceae bacterium KM106-2]|nr:chemotaxis response regulator protein-glutamate methylesterase CheB [Lachnospiraceae bacterium KM106-2]
MTKNILIIDDSALMRRLISDIISSDERYHVHACACNGQQGLDILIKDNKVIDAVILDINMPKMNGLEMLQQLERFRIQAKVIVVSTVAVEGANETIRALELGAFDFVTKPGSFFEAKEDLFKTKVLKSLGVATGLGSERKKSVEPVATKERYFVQSSLTSLRRELREEPVNKKEFVHKSNGTKIIALACSTGGPKALQSVIPKLPKNLDAPMLVVQHMPAGFTKSLAQRLDELSEIHVKEAEDGDILEKGCVYIAKGGFQMRVIKDGAKYRIRITEEAARGGLKPCADIMYESLIDCNFDEFTCVILTGMGGDGTKGIMQLTKEKNLYVIAQDKETSTVYGMPKVVHEAGLTNEVKPLDKIADAMIKNVGVQ